MAYGNGMLRKVFGLQYNGITGDCIVRSHKILLKWSYGGRCGWCGGEEKCSYMHGFGGKT